MADSFELAFAGSPQFAADILQGLLHQGYRLTHVLTQPDRAAGRGKRIRPSPVKSLAQKQGAAVHQPPRLSDITPADLMLTRPDVLVVAAYGLLVPEPWLAWPRAGALNVHASLLPRWRGAAPIERALMAGDAQTGVCIMQMEAGLDTGDILASKSCAVAAEDTAISMAAKLQEMALPLLCAVLQQCQRLGRLPAGTPQAAAGVTYAHKIAAEDRRIDWSNSAAAIARQVRALAGRAGAITALSERDDMKILAVSMEPNSALSGAALHPGTIVRADKSGIQVQCGCGLLNLLQLRLNRGKGALLGYKDALHGFAHLFRTGVQLR